MSEAAVVGSYRDPDAFVAPTTGLIGYVKEGASIWFGAVLRGDLDRMTVGAPSSVRDDCV